MPVWLSIFPQFAKVDKMHNKVMHLQEKSNKYDLTIGPCSLLVNHNDWSR